jgi:hypothetical protein
VIGAAALSSTVLMRKRPVGCDVVVLPPLLRVHAATKDVRRKEHHWCARAPARSPYRRPDSVVADVALVRPTSYQSEDTTGDPCTVVTLTLLTHFPTAGKSSQA